MATIKHCICEVNSESRCYAWSVQIELLFEHTHDSRYKEVNKKTPWLGKIFDPPNPFEVKEGQTYKIKLRNGSAAKCKLLKIASQLPMADVHYIPAISEAKWVWIFLGLEPFVPKF
jgi:hypothetical protein